MMRRALYAPYFSHICGRASAQPSSRRSRGGFTLVEVMIATAVLALGAMLIYEGFFMSIDANEYCLDYLSVASWIDEKMWFVQNELTRYGPLVDIKTVGSFVKRDKDFRWSISYCVRDESTSYTLYAVKLVLDWQRGKKSSRITRNAYALYEKE